MRFPRDSGASAGIVFQQYFLNTRKGDMASDSVSTAGATCELRWQQYLQERRHATTHLHIFDYVERLLRLCCGFCTSSEFVFYIDRIDLHKYRGN